MNRRYCNSVSPSKTHACELDDGHPGKCRQESFGGGYHAWDKP